jgi:hypothetical protein
MPSAPRSRSGGVPGKSPKDEELDRQIRASLERLPRAAPIHEPTKPGGFTPAPGSAQEPHPFPEHPPYRGAAASYYEHKTRSFSPPPGASEAELRAIEREAHSEGARVVRSPESRAAKPDDDLSPEVIATAKLLKTGGAALGKWLVGALVTVVLGGGGALVGSQAANPVPPAVLQCPAELEQLRADMKSLRDRIGATERDLDEATIDRRAQARKHESLQSEVYELGKRVPKIQSVAP